MKQQTANSKQQTANSSLTGSRRKLLGQFIFINVQLPLVALKKAFTYPCMLTYAKLLTVLLICMNTQTSFSQCKPVIVGPHSMCSLTGGATANYIISNFNNTFTYTATVTTYPGQVTTTFPIMTSNFIAFTNYNFQSARVIVNVNNASAGCNDADTIYVQSCCDEAPGVLPIIDLSSNQIQFTASGVYDPTAVGGGPSTVVIHGQLTVDNTFEFRNTTILMDQGASIVVIGSGTQFGLSNCTIRSGRCNFMWEGITLQNNTVFKSENGVTISDAQYALNIEGNAEFHFSANGNQQTIFNQNYISIFAKPNPNGHLILMTGGSNPGISINGTVALNTPFWGQTPLPQTVALAGIYLYDVANFTNKLGPTITPINISNINLGIVSIGGSLSLDQNINLSNIQPALNTINNAHLYTATKRYNGSAVYCEGTTNTAQTLSFGNLANTGNDINIINNCKYGVYAYRNMNVNCINNHIDNITDLGGVRVDNRNIAGRTITIEKNEFMQSFYCAIFCMQLNSASLTIKENKFNTGLTYYPVNINPTQDFANTAIRLAFVSPTTITGEIANNTFEVARIGIYASNIIGSSLNTQSLFKIHDNNFTFDQPNTQYTNGLFTWIHSGIWVEVSRNISISDNIVIRINGLSNAPVGFENFLTGIRLNMCTGGPTLITGNNLTHLGTAIRIRGNCIGTEIYCNSITSDIIAGTQTFPRSIFLNFATLGKQGGAGLPNDNQFLSFNGLTAKISGIVAQPIDWFISTSNQLTPSYVSGPATNNLNITYLSNLPNPTRCNSIPNTPIQLDELYSRVHQVVYGEITYQENPEENTYLDQVFAYNAIQTDSILRSLDPEYTIFLDAHANDNIGTYREAIGLHTDEQILAAIAKLNDIANANTIEFNRVTTERIALLNELEERALNQQEIIDLIPIAESNSLLGGEGVINAQTLLNKEIYDENQSFRIRNDHNNNKSTYEITIKDLYNLSYSDQQLVNVCAYDILGKNIFNGTLSQWQQYKISLPLQLISIKYSFNNNTVGTRKELTK